MRYTCDHIIVGSVSSGSGNKVQQKDLQYCQEISSYSINLCHGANLSSCSYFTVSKKCSNELVIVNVVVEEMSELSVED